MNAISTGRTVMVAPAVSSPQYVPQLPMSRLTSTVSVRAASEEVNVLANRKSFQERRNA